MSTITCVLIGTSSVEQGIICKCLFGSFGIFIAEKYLFYVNSTNAPSFYINMSGVYLYRQTMTPAVVVEMCVLFNPHKNYYRYF